MPQLWIIAGPNGAGKTTLVSRRVASRVPVVNPDTIAEALPRIEGRLDERRAGVLAFEQRRALLEEGANFAIKTTMNGHSALQFMRAAKKAGYKITLVYVGLNSAKTSGCASPNGSGGAAVRCRSKRFSAAIPTPCRS